MPSSLTVAREFHRLAVSEERPITPLELIKFTYLAHGWSLAKREQPLVDEPAEAWKYGPVFPILYHHIKRFGGRSVITIPPLSSDDVSREPLTDEEKRLIQAVYKAYKRFGGIELSALTHQPGSPWEKTWRGPWFRDRKIDNELIKHYYQDLDKQLTESQAE